MIKIFVIFVFSIFISLSSFAHELPVYEETIPTGYWCNLETDKNNFPIGPGDCKKGDVIFDWGASYLGIALTACDLRTMQIFHTPLNRKLEVTNELLLPTKVCLYSGTFAKRRADVGN